MYQHFQIPPSLRTQPQDEGELPRPLGRRGRRVLKRHLPPPPGAEGAQPRPWPRHIRPSTLLRKT